MTDIILYGGPDGTVAIYDGPQSDAIEADPHADISRVRLHSALPYICVTSIIEGTVSLTETGYDASAKKVHNIHTHGLAYTPLVFGMILNYRGLDYEGTISSLAFTTGPVPFSGTVFMGSDTLGTGYSWYRSKLLQLGSNATHVTITDVAGELNTIGSPTALPTYDYELDYRVFITNYALPT